MKHKNWIREPRDTNRPDDEDEENKTRKRTKGKEAAYYADGIQRRIQISTVRSTVQSVFFFLLIPGTFAQCT